MSEVVPSIPEAKITIFIEVGDQIKKITIPHARYLNIENKHGSALYNSIDFTLNCEPQYDIDRNHYLTEEIRTVENSWLKKTANQRIADGEI